MKFPWTATLVTALTFGTTGAALAQDADAGEKVFRKCSSCHNVGDDARNSVGPVLNDVIGRPAGSYDDYRYSDTLEAAGEAGLVWDAEAIADYIADPKKFMQDYLDDPKARPKMRFKLSDEQDRKDVVAYLEQFSEPAEAQDGADDAAEESETQ